ncbi:MAG TPA: rRNA maturation RNase YbeY [Candidatus Limnocylindrales bacterium]|nr:rRNA maturation RNase YbeY [Candidatus Limnocylindrales bacterium]
MILNQQRAVRIPLADLNRFLARARRALRLPPASVTICLVTDSQIARWNRAYRGKNRPTDVLSFPTDVRNRNRNPRIRSHHRRARRKEVFSSTSFTSSPSSTSYLGDIAIAPAVARRNARRFGRSLADELRILILHGLLHLLGYDHETDSGQMDRREQRLRRALGLAAA